MTSVPWLPAGVLVLALSLAPAGPAPQTPPPAAPSALTESQIAHFLATAKVVRSKTISKGVTAPVRLTLTDGTLTHDAAFSTVDEHTPVMKFANGHSELNFVD